MKKVRLDVLIPESDKDSLTQYSQTTHIPISTLVRLAIKSYIDTHIKPLNELSEDGLTFDKE